MTMRLLMISAEEVERHLDYPTCIALMREAMTALSKGTTGQLLRSILRLEDGNAFGVMPGALPVGQPFGAKIVSVYPGNFEAGKPSHQGLVMLFDRDSGAPTSVIEAGSITAIRTASASAAATDALAVEGASTLAILGYGEQAWRHIEAIRHVRPIAEVRVWGRSAERAGAFAERVRSLGVAATASPSVGAAVAGAQIICTTTAAAEPILDSAMVADGAHVNVVGSSYAGPAEIANDLVVRARFFADHRDSVLAQGAEFLRAKQAGLIGDDHILGEIGEVHAGVAPGRVSPSDVTIYKSLGSIVQDLAAAQHIDRSVRAERDRSPSA